MSEHSTPAWSMRSKRTIALLFFLFFVGLAWFIRDVFPIIIISALLAFVINPIVTFITMRVFRSRRNRGFRRGLAVLISFGLVTVLFVVVILVIIPPIIDQVEDFARNIPVLAERLETDLEELLAQPITWNNEPVLLSGEPLVLLDRIEEATGTRDLSDLFQLEALDLQVALDTFLGSARSLSGPAFNFLGGAFTTALNITFLIFLTFYFSKDGHQFSRRLVKLAPAEYQQDVKRLLRDVGDVWHGYVRGQLLLCIAIGLAVYAAATVLGLPNPAILGLIAGILEFIPNLGPLIALIPAAFLALVSQSTTLEFLSGVPFMLVVIAVWTTIQNIEAVVLVPRIMGKSLDLHPLVVIIAVLAGAAIGGALGVILAAPFVASTRILLHYIYAKLTDRPPFVEHEEKAPAPPTTLIKLLQPLWSAGKRAGRWVQSRLRRQPSSTDQPAQE